MLSKILIIDHDEKSHFLIGQYLKKFLAVSTIINLTSPEQINYDLGDFFLIITETWFPDYDVINFIKQTKTKYPRIKIVVVTASYTDTKVVQQAKKAGADYVLAKPLLQKELKNALAELRLIHYSDC